MSNVIGLSQEHEDSLRKLASYLLQPELKAKFDMIAYSDWQHDDESTECGTVGCAAGHGPYAGIEKLSTESWQEYTVRVFGLKNTGYTNTVIITSGEWSWCFHPNWEEIDNTPSGAAKRILWLLKYGMPNDWKDMIYNGEPLWYNHEMIES